MKPGNESFGVNVERIMNLPGGMYAVRLLTKNAAWRETQKLNLHISHLEVLHSMDNTEYYSLRTNDDHARVMLMVKNGAVQMCRGLNRLRPASYMNQIVAFIVDCGFGIDADMACTGLIRQKGRYYNIYDLPQNFIVSGNMDLSYAGLDKLPNMKGVTIKGNYDISGNSLIGFFGAPSVVYGDFIVNHNGFPNVLRQPPKYTTIYGKFINNNIRSKSK